MINNMNETEELTLRDFLAKVAQRFGGNYLYSLMFGSKARGDAHEGSDLDVAVIMQKAAHFPLLREIERDMVQL